ncbi:uncharacterized protein TrAtP1_005900 [Trichoderma atroviride]|uniref:uncharacterized protein n=1 Tax=Hypocrea atroviridis TaxID=63577 RepID=UPI00332DC2B5|nr:hypothetical protein TrAtP1_005900 [Trichoderma atroviride]
MLEGGEVAGGGDPTQTDYARDRAMEFLRVPSGQRGKARLVKRRPASGEEQTGRDGSLADDLGCSEHIDRSGSGGNRHRTVVVVGEVWSCKMLRRAKVMGRRLK